MSNESHHDDIDAQARAKNVQSALNDSSQIIYDGLADDYDRHLLQDCDYNAPAVVAHQVDEHTAGPIHVLDAGAGTGLVGRALVHAGVEADLVGIDLVDSMLDQNNCDAYSHCIVADAARQMPIRPGAFDVAVAAGLMEHVVDPVVFLEDFLRTVRPEGVAVFTYIPNQRGATGVFNRNSGLLSHDPHQIAEAVNRISGDVIDRTRFNAYRNGENWVENEVVTIACP